MMELTDCNC